jgi:hypothetical protein
LSTARLSIDLRQAPIASVRGNQTGKRQAKGQTRTRPKRLLSGGRWLMLTTYIIVSSGCTICFL